VRLLHCYFSIANKNVSGRADVDPMGVLSGRVTRRVRAWVCSQTHGQGRGQNSLPIY
jgi:hypothetical protein